jgi:hypothetical protein
MNAREYYISRQAAAIEPLEKGTQAKKREA